MFTSRKYVLVGTKFGGLAPNEEQNRFGGIVRYYHVYMHVVEISVVKGIPQIIKIHVVGLTGYNDPSVDQVASLFLVYHPN